MGDSFTFDIDTQYQALLAKTIIEDFHVIWIGVSASNIGYYLGPGLVYITAFLLWISHGDPISLAFFSSFIGVFTALSIYIIGNDLFGKRVALTAMILYGFSLFIINYDHHYWPIFIPLTALWMYYSLVKAQKNSRWLILSAILISLSYHIHLSLLVFWPFVIWSFIKLFRKIDLITWIVSIGSYFVITFPLLVFDFVHNFDNMLFPIKFVRNMDHSPVGLTTHFSYLLILINKIFFSDYQKIQIASLFLAVFFILILIHILRLKKTFSHNLLIAITVLFSLLFGFYPGLLQEYYIVFLFPFIAFTAAFLLGKARLSISVVFIILFIGVNLYGFFTYKNSRGLTAKKNLITKTMKEVKGDYYLSYDTALDYEGWRYLFEAYGKKPSQSKTDSMFGWIYPKDISKDRPPLTVNISSDFKVTIW